MLPAALLNPTPAAHRILHMKNTINLSILAVFACLVTAAGCGPNVGYVVKPIPHDERLVETTIASDPGMWISDKIAVIDVDGLIMNQRMGMLGLDDNPVTLFVEKVDMAQADPSVKAVVLRINSPGGGVTASDIMHRRLVELKAARKIPVVAIIEDVGASGGYYIACAGDTIMAHPTAITGSIGVIVQTFSIHNTLDKIGVQVRAVTSGPRKDMGSPLKPLNEEDTAVIQGMVENFYKHFIEAVQAGRPKLKAEQIIKLADGRVYTADQAKENGLIDDIGYMRDALALARKMGHMNRAKAVIYGRPWGYRPNAYAASGSGEPSVGTQVNLVNISAPELMRLASPQFLYLWTPGL